MKKTAQHNQNQLEKVVFYGPESTGKTTLAKTLAQTYQTTWVPEFAREYLQDKYDKTGKACEASDIKPIVEGQLKTENELIQQANQYLFCDTDPLETYVYAKVYFPEKDFSWLDKLNEDLNYTHYFLTYIDTPWEADDLRDKPHERKDMYDAFLSELKRRNKKFTILKGNLKQRTAQVIKILKVI